MPRFRWRRAAISACLAGLTGSPLPAQTVLPAQPAAAAASAPAAARPAATAASAAAAPQRVEVTGSSSPDGEDERRRATASRITVGREELDRMGDTTLGEVLKRLPGVTLGGPPGRGGGVRMRGMGGGYTQVLIDGQRMPPGFSLDAIAPEQIEKIEIMRAPVAEFGTRAIAGTINVVMRSDFKRRSRDLKLGGGFDGSRGQGSASWAANGQADRLGWNLAATAIDGGQDSESETRTLGLAADGSTVLDQRLQSTLRGSRRGLFTSARLQWRLSPGNSLELQPFLNLVRSRGDGLALLDERAGSSAPYARASSQRAGSWQMARLAGSWNATTGSGGRWLLRFGGRLADSSNSIQRQESGGRAGGGQLRLDDSSNRETALDASGKFSQLLAERHSASVGWEAERSRRDDRRSVRVDGLSAPGDFGETLSASMQRLALYAQDEWDWSRQFSFYVGARWEGIDTRSDALALRPAVHNRSSVFAPLAHMVWRFADAPRDQLRLSLTRSYRSPNLNQLVARPAQSEDSGFANSASHPDRSGNPALRPELSWGLELALEHYPDAGGVLSANLHARRIDDLIRNQTRLQSVPWAAQPRWVAQPQNIGQADAAGLELEAKARLGEVWAGTPTALQGIQLRANASLMWSRVQQVPGPHNRLEGQPPWTANLGLDWPLRGGPPLTLGASLNLTPAFRVQEIDGRSSRQGVKPVLDLSAHWRLHPDASLRLSIGNATAHRVDSSSSSLLADGSSETVDSRSRSFTNLNLRAELRF